MTIELTADQQQALDASKEMLTLIDPRSQQEYVLVQSEVFQRLRGVLAVDFDAEDAFQAQINSAAAAGWDDPVQDIYNQLDPRRKA